MSYSLHEGIILRSYLPKKQKLTVLDSKLGKIECIPNNCKSLYSLSNGSLISYFPKIWKENYYNIIDIEVLQMPFYWGQSNLLFFHHVLELCDYFLPFEDKTSNDIFDLIILLYASPEKVKSVLSKKLFLCAFFKKLEIYPDDVDSYDSVILNLISDFLHSSLSDKYEMSVNTDLRRWLFGCVNAHPKAHRLRTIEFLNEL